MGNCPVGICRDAGTWPKDSNEYNANANRIVEYATRDEAQNAVNTLSNQNLMGRLVYVREVSTHFNRRGRPWTHMWQIRTARPSLDSQAPHLLGEAMRADHLVEGLVEASEVATVEHLAEAVAEAEVEVESKSSSTTLVPSSNGSFL